MPTPVVTALVILIGVCIFAALNVAGGLAGGRTNVVGIWAGLAAITAYAALGTWKRWVSGQSVAVVAGALAILVGLFLTAVIPFGNLGLIVAAVGAAIVGLVVVPSASRDWFSG